MFFRIILNNAELTRVAKLKYLVNSGNINIATLSRINRNEIGMILSKYNIPSLNLSVYPIKCGNILLMLDVIVGKCLFCNVNRIFFSMTAVVCF